MQQKYEGYSENRKIIKFGKGHGIQKYSKHHPDNKKGN